MKTTHYPLTLFVTGLALALENIESYLQKNPHERLKAYFFSFESQKAELYFTNIMNLAKDLMDRKEISNFWAMFVATEYSKKTSLGKEDCIKEFKDLFTIHKQDLAGDIFDFSKLNGSGRIHAQDIYKKHSDAFVKIVLAIYNSKLALDTEWDYGIIFIEKEP